MYTLHIVCYEKIFPQSCGNTLQEKRFSFQEEQRLRIKKAKEDLEDFLLHTDKMNSMIKYRLDICCL